MSSIGTKNKCAVYIQGGLGNQLFEIACLLAYCKKEGKVPIFDKRFVGELHTSDIFYEQFSPILKDKNMKEGFLSQDFMTYQENDRVFQSPPSFPCKDVLLRGYFNDERYFSEMKDEIKELFRECICKKLGKHCFPIEKRAMHVRRGDYLKYSEVFYTLEPLYYENAQKLTSSIYTSVVSEEKLSPYGLDGSEGINGIHGDEFICGGILEDFYFLMNCRYLIMANSTYSWWAGYLNPFAEKIIFPLEWFKNDLKHTYKYAVQGWVMQSGFSEEEILSYLDLYQEKNMLHSFKTVMKHYPFTLNNISKVNNTKMMRYQLLTSPTQALAEEVLSTYLQRKELQEVNPSMRKIIHSYSQLQAEYLVQLEKIPLYVISGEERREEMKKRFSEQNLLQNMVIVEGVKAKEKSEGCTKAHIKALRTAIETNQYPFVIFEDDLAFTGVFRKSFKVSKLFDAVYLGMSRHGMGGWNQMGIKNFLEITNDVQIEDIQFFQIKNMLSGHGILYLTELYARKCLQLIEACLDLKIINDAGQARCQQFGNVMCTERPFVVQDVSFAKSSHQRQNNMETYLSVKEFIRV